jgi:hypothetical protein
MRLLKRCFFPERDSLGHGLIENFEGRLGILGVNLQTDPSEQV